MQIEMKNFSVHLGSHGTQVGGDHRFSKPKEGVQGLCLPFQTFSAKDQESAEQTIRDLNAFADVHNLDAMDLSRLLFIVDRASGK